MELSIRVYEDSRLLGLTFTDVFREFAEMAHRNWERQQVRYHIVRRASRCCQRRLMQPDYAAMFLNDRRDESASTCDTAW